MKLSATERKLIQEIRIVGSLITKRESSRYHQAVAMVKRGLLEERRTFIDWQYKQFFIRTPGR